MSSIPKSNARMEFRLPAKWKSQIERAATLQNRSLSEFATATLTAAAQAVLAEHDTERHVSLSNRDRDRFLAMLDAEEGPNAALAAAAREYAKVVRKK